MKLFNIFVGEGGCYLGDFNSQNSPFPPTKPNTEGYVAIGWSKVGSMNMYTGSYSDYQKKFHQIYPKHTTQQCNIPWYFAFDMKQGDWVRCPFSEGILIGEIISDYLSNHDNNLGIIEFMGTGYLHLRKVRWEHFIPKSDPRYSKLNRAGLLTVSQPSDLDIDGLKSILNEVTPN